MISTHVLDTARGRPAAGLAVTAYVLEDTGEWQERGYGVTDADGRIKPLVDFSFQGVWKLVFATKKYDPDGFFPEVHIVFEIKDREAHFHVPLLLSPFGYSTYRGS